MDRARDRDRDRESRDGAWASESDQTVDRDDDRDWKGPWCSDDGAGADSPGAIEAAAAASSLAPDDLHALLRLALGPTELRAAAARMLAAELSAGFGEARSSASRQTLPASQILPPSAVEIGPGAPAPQARHHSARPWLLGAGAALLVLALGGRFGAAPLTNRTEAGGGITLDAPPEAMSPSLASTSSAARKSLPQGALVSPEGARPAAAAASVTAAVPAAEATVILATPEALGSLSSTPTAAGVALGSMATPPLPPAAPTDASLGYATGAPCGQRVPGAIGATEAEAALDRFVTVEFAVRGSKDTGKVTFLNSQMPYQGRFYVALFPDLYPAFPPSPAESLRGRCVLVQGRVEAYRGVPQIVLRQAADLKDLGSAEEGAATVGRP